MLTELDTRHLPYERIELTFAANRPHAERPPLPHVGEQLLYRREYWDQHPVPVTVVWVQDLQDRTDPNLWHEAKDLHGAPIVDRDGARFYRTADPWPEVRLRGMWPPYEGAKPELREALTREARLRGSPGWLPLDWRLRPVRTPAELYLIERPPLAPVNVPYGQFARTHQGG